ncbi:hypothetical protein [Micromonospora zamorensis]|uniref:hypothetical protein n=1 Tax=Micromonospora zamorensis TaxID=709883 RepID=UPI003CF67D79
MVVAVWSAVVVHVAGSVGVRLVRLVAVRTVLPVGVANLVIAMGFGLAVVAVVVLLVLHRLRLPRARHGADLPRRIPPE